MTVFIYLSRIDRWNDGHLISRLNHHFIGLVVSIPTSNINVLQVDTVMRQLPKTFSVMPVYSSSRKGYSFEIGSGAGRDLEDREVQLEQAAK